MTTTFKVNTNVPRLTSVILQTIENKGHLSFTTLNNGDNPFRVTLRPSSISITDNSEDYMDDSMEEPEPRQDGFRGLKIKIKTASEIWIGSGSYNNYQDLKYPHFFGPSALIVIPHEKCGNRDYGDLVIVVTGNVTSFRLEHGERITRFISTVQNSATAYGWIESTRGKYFLESFNCATGFIPHGQTPENLFCVDDRVTNLMPIQGLSVMIPERPYIC